MNLFKKGEEDHAEFHITETLCRDGEYILSGIMVQGHISLK